MGHARQSTRLQNNSDDITTKGMYRVYHEEVYDFNLLPIANSSPTISKSYRSVIKNAKTRLCCYNSLMFIKRNFEISIVIKSSGHSFFKQTKNQRKFDYKT